MDYNLGYSQVLAGEYSVVCERNYLMDYKMQHQCRLPHTVKVHVSYLIYGPDIKYVGRKVGEVCILVRWPIRMDRFLKHEVTRSISTLPQFMEC